MYIIQWVLICWGMGILGYQTFSTVGVITLFPLFILMTFTVQYLKDCFDNVRQPGMSRT